MLDCYTKSSVELNYNQSSAKTVSAMLFFFFRAITWWERKLKVNCSYINLLCSILFSPVRMEKRPKPLNKSDSIWMNAFGRLIVLIIRSILYIIILQSSPNMWTNWMKSMSCSLQPPMCLMFISIAVWSVKVFPKPQGRRVYRETFCLKKPVKLRKFDRPLRGDKS